MKNKVGDARYRKTEQNIFRALSDILIQKPYTISLRARDLAKQSQVSYSTLYRHHKNLDQILPKYEKKILLRYQRLNKLHKRQSPQQKFNNLLIFIFHNQDFFTIQFTRHNIKFIFRLFECLNIHISQRPDRQKIFYYEIYLIIEAWSIENYVEQNFQATLNQLVKLTQTLQDKHNTTN